MASIKNQDEQRKALKNINDSIKDLKVSNEFLKQQNPSGNYTIAFTGEDGKKYTAEISVEKKDDIAMLIMSHKEKEKQRISELAERNGIALDPEDIEILDFQI